MLWQEGGVIDNVVDRGTSNGISLVVYRKEVTEREHNK